MHFNYYFLKKTVDQLDQYLQNTVLISCFSQNKNELILEFEHPTNHKLFYIKALLDGDASFISFPNSFARAKKNSVALFAQIVGKQVVKVKQFINERSFLIRLNDHTLVFKLHGRRANILLFKEHTLELLFKNSIANDKNITLEQLDRPLNQSLDSVRASGYDLKKHFPTFDKNILEWLNDKSFESLTSQNKDEVLTTLLLELNNDSYYVKEYDTGVKLSLLEPPMPYVFFNDPILASNNFAIKFHKTFHSKSLKSKLVSHLNKEINRSNNYLSKNKSKLEQLILGRKYDELANILMANLHVAISPEQLSIQLFDFYHNDDITIKIKKNTSLQNTASNYYKKSKNQSKEIENLNKNIRIKEKVLKELKESIQHLEGELSITELKKLHQQLFKNPDSKQKEAAPFMEFIVDGYTLWVGRNAKNNDLLTQGYAKKNDLWLHAKDVSGSHAVLRSSGNDKYPMYTIEKVAALVAWHSKRKNDTLCPVLYTLKKYVRKPKGSLPGQVIVSQEEVVLVKPNRILAT